MTVSIKAVAPLQQASRHGMLRIMDSNTLRLCGNRQSLGVRACDHFSLLPAIRLVLLPKCLQAFVEPSS